MRFSIRSYLLLNLLLSVALVTSLMVIASLFLNHRRIKANIDTELILNALTIESLLGDTPSSVDINKLQNKIKGIPIRWQQIQKSPNIKMGDELAEKASFKIWNKDGKLLLDSYSPLGIKMPHEKLGFSDKVLGNVSWRIFTLHDQTNGLTVITAERYDFHTLLEQQIATNSLVILFLGLPLLGLLIWLIVGRGLNSISHVTNEIKNREPGDLRKVSLTPIPTEIKPLVEELNILFNKVRDAFLHEERFSSDAAHELRTPLAALRAHVNVALNAPTEEARKQALKKIIMGIDRGTHVVQQLLTLSRIAKTSTQDKIKNLPVNLNAVAAEIIAEMYPLARENGIDIELVAPEKPNIIQNDPIMLGIMLKNLIGNSIRYIKEEGNIQIVIQDVKQKVILKVIDNGPGIPKKMHKQVFDRFFRGGENTAPGSGLGLSIVQQIATRSNAKIKLKTPSSGKGLEVDVIFPKASSRQKGS